MKAGLGKLTRSVAVERAPLGIRVNAIAPDGMPTEGDRQAREQLLSTTTRYDPVLVPPAGLATGEEAAAAAVFLASDLSRFVTGTTVHVDGGMWPPGGCPLTPTPPPSPTPSP